MRGFKQIPDKYYKPFSISSNEKNAMTVETMLVIMLTTGWVTSDVDIKSR